MSVTVTVAGQSYSVPNTGDSNWDVDVTNLLIALATNTKILSVTSSNFPIVQDVQWGSTYGHRAAYYKSLAASPSSSGQVRLGNTEAVSWRNAGNSGDLALSASASDRLQFSSVNVPTISSTDTLTNKTMSGASNTFSSIGYSSLTLTGSVVNADVSNSAAIAYSKLNLTDGIVNADVSGSAAITYSKLNLTGGVVNADISGSAAIAYSKLNLATSIVNADISSSAAIAYSKLNLGTSIVNADISTSAAIARSKMASGTASHVVINDGSGDLSSEAQLSISRGGTGQATANAALNALLPSQTGANNKVLKSNGTDTSWAVAGSGGGAKNYLGTINGTDNGGDFEGNSVGSWVLGNASLTSAFPSGSPTFGSGASGNLSGSIVSSGQLAGSYSYSYASSAATTAGNFLASPAFTIDIEDQAKVLTFRFAYKAQTNPTNANWSGTSSNSFGVAIYDVTNSAWIMPAGVWGMTQSSGVGICTGTFQTTADSTSYRLVVFNANATSGAVTLYFDDFSLSPQTAPIGAVVADLGTETWTDNQANATTSVKLLRVGNRLFVDGTVTFTGAMSGGFDLTVPAAYTPAYGSTGQIYSTNVALLDTGSVTHYGHLIRISGSNTLTIYALSSASTYTDYTALSATVPHTWASGDFIRFQADWEVVGWASNVQMSNDTDTRVVAAYTSTTTPNSTPTGSYAKITWSSSPVVKDTHGGWSSANNQYAIPVSGFYEFNLTAENTSTSATAGANLLARVNNTTTGDTRAGNTQFTTSGSVRAIVQVNAILWCNAGDLVQFDILNSAGGTLSFSSAGSGTHFSIRRLSGPAVVAATETVGFRVYSSAAQTGINPNNSDVKLTFDTASNDSHGAFASNKFTSLVSGRYIFQTTMNMSGTNVLANTYQIRFYKNGSAYDRGAAAVPGAGLQFYINATSSVMQLNAGDYVEIYLYGAGNNSASTLSTIGGSVGNWFSGYRIGN